MRMTEAEKQALAIFALQLWSSLSMRYWACWVAGSVQASVLAEKDWKINDPELVKQLGDR
jgi:hypothetical protein